MATSVPAKTEHIWHVEQYKHDKSIAWINQHVHAKINAECCKIHFRQIVVYTWLHFIIRKFLVFVLNTDCLCDCVYDDYDDYVVTYLFVMKYL